MLTNPSRLTFWRWVLVITSPLAWLSMLSAYSLAKKLGLSPITSKTWLLLLAAMALTAGISLFVLVFSFTPMRKRFAAVDINSKIPNNLRWLGYPLLLASLVAYPGIMLHPYYGELLAKQIEIRLFLFWMLSLAGMGAFVLAQSRQNSGSRPLWPTALIITILLQACIQRVALYLPDISAYPFAMGWSETSRFYYPALFMSRTIFGQSLSWPILHPSLHLLLTPPYLFAAPLWFHRFWQVAMRFLLVGLIVPALIQRLKISTPHPQKNLLDSSGTLRWLTGLWMFLILFTLPLYLHLAVPVFIVLWGVSTRDNMARRSWFWLMLASIWAGLSRLNWYPMPGMLAAALYFLEIPIQKKSWGYLIKPVLWFVVSTAVAFGSMQIYIAISGISNPGNFFTSLSSTKLWERLLPNASYSLGVLPGIIIFSAPFWLLLFAARRHFRAVERLRAVFLLGELLILFMGGLIVSMKIGGGADIHNMDAYAVLLLVISAYLFWGKRKRENSNQAAHPANSPLFQWGIIALLVMVPAWFSVLGWSSIWQYDTSKSQDTLKALQQQVDQVNSQGSEILFITQRHLISMQMLKGVTLIPEYEREELMEMAMAQNDAYLQVFRADIEKHRFAAIVVDPLRFNFVGEQDAMGAENNAWTRYVVKKILCNYKQAAIFPADRIAIYVPQVGEQTCP